MHIIHNIIVSAYYVLCCDKVIRNILIIYTSFTIIFQGKRYTPAKVVEGTTNTDRVYGDTKARFASILLDTSVYHVPRAFHQKNCFRNI